MKPAGEWNRARIVSRGPRLEVSINGEQVSAIDLDRWTEPLRRPDGTMHNVNGTPKVNTPFNFGMPKDLKEKTVTFDKAEGLFPLNCSVHPWMRSYCAVLTNPYFAVTGADGKFTGAVPDMKEGDVIRMRTCDATGKTGDWVTVRASGVADASPPVAASPFTGAPTRRSSSFSTPP